MCGFVSGKEEVVVGAITVERGLRNKLAEVQRVFSKLAREKDFEEEKEENIVAKEQI